MGKVRMLLPQGIILTLLDCVLSDKLNRFVDLKLSAKISKDYYIGAKRGTQPMDIAFASHLALDKSSDLNSHGSVAQMDVGQYYDNLPLRLISLWFKTDVVPHLCRSSDSQASTCRINRSVDEALSGASTTS